MTTWVLLRGLAREAGHWDHFVSSLRAQTPAGDRIIALSLPGNGALHRQRSPAHVDAMVDALRDRLLPRGGAPYLVVALSLGAMVAMRWAERYPGELCGVVLVNSSFGGLSPFWRRLRPSCWAPLLSLMRPGLPVERREKRVLELTSNRRPVDPAIERHWTHLAEVHPTSRANVLRQLRAAASYRLPPQCPPVPMLLLASLRDRLVSPECSRDLARAWSLPLHLHSDTGHDIAIDDPRWLLEHVLVFREHGARRHETATDPP